MDHSPLAQTLARLGATMKPVVLPTRRIRCLVANYYVDGEVAVEGKTYAVAVDLARALVKFGRAEYA
jgi:hypothetical protein